MFAQLFNQKPVLEPEDSQWLFDTFAWSLAHFDADVFFNQTELVLPDDSFFPGSESSAQGMAELVFAHVKKYAGLNHWPCQVINAYEAVDVAQSQPLRISSGRGTEVAIVEEDLPTVPIYFDPDQLRDPEVLIATYAHSLSYYLGLTAQEPPPGGKENLAHATELLSVFMGFGVIMANSAFTAKVRSCASCSGPAVERTNFLSQYEITYALAIFSALKSIPHSQVQSSLKKSLRTFYKRAAKEVDSKIDQLTALRRIDRTLRSEVVSVAQ